MTLTPEPVATFITREEADKVTFGNGFRIPHPEQNGWLGYTSTTAQGQLWIARESGPAAWLLALSHPASSLN